MRPCMHIISAHLDSQSNLRLSTNSASPSDAWHGRILKAIKKAMETSSSWNSIGLALFWAVVARSMLRSQVSACYNMLGQLQTSQNLVRGSKIPTLAFPWLNSRSFGSPHPSRKRSHMFSQFFFLLTHEKNYRPPAKATWLHLALASFTKFLLSAWTYCMIMMVKMRRKKNSRRTPYFVIAKQGLAKSSTSWCPLQLPPANRIQAATLWIQCHSCKESSAISSANLCLVKSHCH